MKIAIVGGGSTTWAPRMLQDFLLTGPLADANFMLLDIDQAAADLMSQFATQLAKQLNAAATFTATDDRALALDGADYVIITITTGGLDAMAQDLAIPERYGIYHTVGDTCGPGGWSRFIRNFDVFVSLANAINEYAPGAAVINYTNPMATLTTVLSRICTGPVVGLCHGLLENRDFLSHRYGGDIAMVYAGVNHFFWTTQATVDGSDILADLASVAEHTHLEELEPKRTPDPFGFVSGRAVATELYRLTGVLPYVGDRHTCEFMSWYITDPALMDRYGLRRTSIANRREILSDQQETVRRMVRDGIPDGWVRRTRETAAAIVHAHRFGEPFVDVGNVVNAGQVANLPEGVAVETPVRFGPDGFVPVEAGSLPASVVTLVEPWTYVYGLQLQACFDHDRRRALDALRLDPTCARLSTSEVQEMGEALLAANRPYASWL
jgi:alpha-galactosidase/6-phospho-beta-glucosidase family protein